MIPNILDCDKVEFHFSQEEFLKELNNRWNAQYTNNVQKGVFFQSNAYLNALFQLRFLGVNNEVRKNYRDMKDDMFLDTEILLKERTITVYDIKGIDILYGGKVIAILKNDKKSEIYTRNHIGREPMLVKNKSQIYLSRPGIEDYYKQNKERYPGIMELNICFQKLPTPKYLSSKFSYANVAEWIYKHLKLTPQK